MRTLALLLAVSAPSAAQCGAFADLQRLAPDAALRAMTPRSAPVKKAAKAGKSCVARAKGHSSLTPALSERLCAGAETDAPAACYEKAYELAPLTPAQALSLCSGASSDAPVICARHFLSLGGLPEALIVSRCLEN